VAWHGQLTNLARMNRDAFTLVVWILSVALTSRTDNYLPIPPSDATPPSPASLYALLCTWQAISATHYALHTTAYAECEEQVWSARTWALR